MIGESHRLLSHSRHLSALVSPGNRVLIKGLLLLVAWTNHTSDIQWIERAL